MKIQYHPEENLTNRCFDHLLKQPENLSAYVDVTRWEQLPADLNPWSMTIVDRHKVIDILKKHRVNETSLTDLKQDNCLVVMAGQQPGLMGGPLYSLYKALTAVRLAEKLSEKYKVPVVPIFCNLSDDHDWGEANRTALWLDAKWQNSRIKEEISGAHLFDKFYPESWEKLCEVMQISSATFTSKYYQFTTDDNWGSFLTRFMQSLFEGTSLVVVEQRWFRSLQASFLQSVIDKHNVIEQSLMMAGSALSLAGYDQALQNGKGYHICFASDERRERLQDVNGELGGRHKIIGTIDKVKNLIERHPEQFSCNVVTRPLWMRQLFPVVSEIVGPGETSYQLQLQGIYRLLGIQAPVLTPRLSVCLLRERDVKRLKNIKHEAWHVFGNCKVNVDKNLQESIEDRLNGIKQLFVSMSSQITENYPEITDKMIKAEQRLERDLRRIPQMLLRAQSHRQEEYVSQWESLVNWINPLGKPQERVLSFASLSLLLGEEWWIPFCEQVDALCRETAWVALDV